jgi:hypothetical protein
MALADRITQPAPERVHGLPCSVGKLLEELPADEAAALQHMLSNGWSQTQIFEALKAEGHVVGMQTPNRHRSRACRCFR